MSSTTRSGGAATNRGGRGIKRRCRDCDAPFYDMMRYPIRCPKCGAEFDAAASKKLSSEPRPPRGQAARIGRSVAAKAVPTAEEREQPPEPEEDEAEANEDEDEDRVDGDDGDDEEDDDADAGEDIGDDEAPEDR